MQDQNTYKVKKNTIYNDKRQHANPGGKRLFQAAKQHLYKGKTVKNEMWDTYLLLVELFRYLMKNDTAYIFQALLTVSSFQFLWERKKQQQKKHFTGCMLLQTTVCSECNSSCTKSSGQRSFSYQALTTWDPLSVSVHQANPLCFCPSS